jgi:DNA excision repair protein ERCC-3
MGQVFIETNMWVYAFGVDETTKNTISIAVNLVFIAQTTGGAFTLVGELTSAKWKKMTPPQQNGIFGLDDIDKRIETRLQLWETEAETETETETETSKEEEIDLVTIKIKDPTRPFFVVRLPAANDVVRLDVYATVAYMTEDNGALRFLNKVAAPVSRQKRINHFRIDNNSLYAALTKCVSSAADEAENAWGKLVESEGDKAWNELVELTRNGEMKHRPWFVGRYTRSARLERGPESLRIFVSDPGLRKHIFDEGEKCVVIDTDVALMKSQAFVENLPIVDSVVPTVWKQGGGTNVWKRTLTMKMKADVAFRDYQTQALDSIMPLNADGEVTVARSGIVVMPCGSGKTLVGIGASVRAGLSTLVICPSNHAVDQWVQSFKEFTDLDMDLFSRTFIGDEHIRKNEAINAATLVFTTYSFLRAKNTAKQADYIFSDIMDREWGVVLIDEVHKLPTIQNFAFLTKIKAGCKIGLTATLVREDEGIEQLVHYVGPTMIDLDWQSLTTQKYLAAVALYTIIVDMPGPFESAYAEPDNDRVRKMIQSINPYKIEKCRELIQNHENQKILLYADSVLTLRYYAKALQITPLHGDTPLVDRATIFENFRKPTGESDSIDVMIVSRVGDEAIDLPSASVLIQLDSFGMSRRQEAQRLGRVLRIQEDKKSVFYTLTSRGTREQKRFLVPRQRFLVDQGYSYEVRQDNESKRDPQRNERHDKADIDAIIKMIKYVEDGEGAEIAAPHSKRARRTPPEALEALGYLTFDRFCTDRLKAMEDLKRLRREQQDLVAKAARSIRNQRMRIRLSKSYDAALRRLKQYVGGAAKLIM